VRKDGVSKATGEFTLLLDGDDELTPDFLENLYRGAPRRDADIVHFGITVVSEGVSKERARLPSRPTTTVPSGVFAAARCCEDLLGGRGPAYGLARHAARVPHSVLQRAFSS
jgi:glycosyltransferase involved in cell wall biosynthesis